MRLQCAEHGEVDEFHLDGYSAAHERPVSASERDFEGITFVVENPRGEEVTAEHISTESGAEGYLSKFANWDDEIAQLVTNYYDNARGVEQFSCPHDSHTSYPPVTHVVDEVFTLDADWSTEISLVIHDNTLYIFSVENNDSYEVSEVLETVVEHARGEPQVNDVHFGGYNIEPYKDSLEKLGFEITVTRRDVGQETLEEVEATLELNNTA